MGEDNVLNVLDGEKKISQLEQQAIPKAETEEDQQAFLFDALSDETINDQIHDVRHKLVVLVGMPSSGKSTFVGSMYHLFMSQGKIGNYKFIDSETYVGMERRVYLRYAHGPNMSDTKRTGSLEGHILVFELENSKSHAPLQLVISDRTGEIYKDYAEGKADMANDRSLLAAELVYIFVDAGDLTGSANLTVTDKYEKIVAQMACKKVIKSESQVFLVFNKQDLVEKCKERYELKRNRFIDSIKTKMGIQKISYYEVKATSPQDKNLINLYKELLAEAEKNSDGAINRNLDWVSQKIKDYK